MIRNEWRYIRALCLIWLFINPVTSFAQEDVERPTNAVEKPPIFDTMELLTEQLRPFNVKASLYNEVATLRGTVNNVVEKDLAEAIARSVEGVTTIDSQIKIKTESEKIGADKFEKTVNIVSTQANSGIRAWIQDFFISLKIKLKLLFYQTVSGFRIHVDTLNGVVSLSGNVSTYKELRRATMLSRDTYGVIEVRNETNLKDGNVNKTPDRSSEKLPQKVVDTREIFNDGWITAKIKSSFIANGNIQAEDINVDTRDGVVVLSGHIDNISQKELAIKTARNISGVKDVQSQLRLPE